MWWGLTHTCLALASHCIHALLCSSDQSDGLWFAQVHIIQTGGQRTGVRSKDNCRKSPVKCWSLLSHVGIQCRWAEQIGTPSICMSDPMTTSMLSRDVLVLSSEWSQINSSLKVWDKCPQFWHELKIAELTIRPFCQALHLMQRKSNNIAHLLLVHLNLTLNLTLKSHSFPREGFSWLLCCVSWMMHLRWLRNCLRTSSVDGSPKKITQWLWLKSPPLFVAIGHAIGIPWRIFAFKEVSSFAFKKWCGWDEGWVETIENAIKWLVQWQLLSHCWVSVWKAWNGELVVIAEDGTSLVVGASFVHFGNKGEKDCVCVLFFHSF